MDDTYKSDIHHRLDQGLALKYMGTTRRVVWMSSPTSSTDATTPADFATLGQQGNAVKRAQKAKAMTAAERATYRRGYLAAAQAGSRWRRLVERVLQSLQHGAGREIP